MRASKNTRPEGYPIPEITPALDVGPWTQFMDMHSGGGQKEWFSHCYIQAPEAEARIIFYNRFGHSPDRIYCTCCGEDYSLTESKTLHLATAYERGCAYENGEYAERPDTGYRGQHFKSLSAYLADEDVCVIPSADIKPQERAGYVPQQGYVWQD